MPNRAAGLTISVHVFSGIVGKKLPSELEMLVMDSVSLSANLSADMKPAREGLLSGISKSYAAIGLSSSPHKLEYMNEDRTISTVTNSTLSPASVRTAR